MSVSPRGSVREFSPTMEVWVKEEEIRPNEQIAVIPTQPEFRPSYLAFLDCLTAPMDNFEPAAVRLQLAKFYLESYNQRTDDCAYHRRRMAEAFIPTVNCPPLEQFVREAKISETLPIDNQIVNLAQLTPVVVPDLQTRVWCQPQYAGRGQPLMELQMPHHFTPKDAFLVLLRYLQPRRNEIGNSLPPAVIFHSYTALARFYQTMQSKHKVENSLKGARSTMGRYKVERIFQHLLLLTPDAMPIVWKAFGDWFEIFKPHESLALRTLFSDYITPRLLVSDGYTTVAPTFPSIPPSDYASQSANNEPNQPNDLSFLPPRSNLQQWKNPNGKRCVRERLTLDHYTEQRNDGLVPAERFIDHHMTIMTNLNYTSLTRQEQQLQQGIHHTRLRSRLRVDANVFACSTVENVLQQLSAGDPSDPDMKNLRETLGPFLEEYRTAFCPGC
jgi:hypothetical protein